MIRRVLSSRVCLGLGLGALLATSSCHYVRKANVWEYEPRAGRVAMPSPSSVVYVAPFHDDRLSNLAGRYDFAVEGGGFHYDYTLDSLRYAGTQENVEPRLATAYAEWWAEDLQASGVLPEATYVTWRELAERPWPDLVVSGTIVEDGVRSPYLVPLSIVGFVTLGVLFGLPQEILVHHVRLELVAFRPDKPEDVLWRTSVEAERSYKVHLVYWGVGWYVAPLEDHAEMAAEMFAKARAKLATFLSTLSGPALTTQPMRGETHARL